MDTMDGSLIFPLYLLAHSLLCVSYLSKNPFETGHLTSSKGSETEEKQMYGVDGWSWWLTQALEAGTQIR